MAKHLRIALLILLIATFPLSSTAHVNSPDVYFDGYAGPYHLLPLLPVLAEARRRLPLDGVGAQFAVFPLLFFAAVTTRACLADIKDRATWPVEALPSG